MNTNNATRRLVRLPSMTRGADAASSFCRCGCRSVVPRSYRPGHDGWLCGAVLRVLKGQLTVAWFAEVDLGSGTRHADAIIRELRDRSLPHIDWSLYPVDDVKSA